MDRIHEQIISMSYAHFSAHPATPDTIREYVERAKGFFPEHKLDEIELFNELEAIHSVFIQNDIRILEDSSDHHEWFNPDTGRPLNRDFDWHFWDHYRQYLQIQKQWSPKIVQALDRYSSLVLCRVEDPLRAGPWDRRGMVVGSVQSGKTANYTALITKATDSGYKLFVVLAGVHNSLRSQTQERLNEEYLGYDLDVIQKITGQERRIGVRRMFRNNHRVVNTLTSSAQNGDFRTSVARQAGIIPSMTGDPIILVAKKNATILRNIIEWATSLGEANRSGRRIVREIPFILIDDECDFASVNTHRPAKDENGRIIEEWNPTKINMLIRQLLSSFDKSIYIGFTATPYANIFIDKDAPHPVYGDDLFPKHFLVSLPQPSNYVGPEEVFGLREDMDAGIEAVQPLPLLRSVQDNEDVIPSSHKPYLEVLSLPDSIVEALKAYCLVCAARRRRARGVPHNSMLIHVTRYTRVQRQVKELVESELRTLTARIMSGTDPLEDLHQIWEQDFIPTSLDIKRQGSTGTQTHSWEHIRSELYEAVKVMRVKGINGETADTLDYRTAERRTRERTERGEVVPWHDRGTSVIAIGGDKLSRGLTLDGLSVSYYLRSARMYDTLMQMGRWFGYRDGYDDLCRMYTTDELIEWYRHIALANRELRNEFDYMEAIGSTPETFGLRVRSHPGRLAITSAGKARATERMPITFSGSLEQTIVFDPTVSQHNIFVLRDLIKGIGREPDVEFDAAKPRFQWTSIDPSLIVDFLRSYRTHDEAKRVADPQKWADYISRQVALGELTNWHVVIVSNLREHTFHSLSIEGYRVPCVQRKPIICSEDKISIGALTSPADLILDMTQEEMQEARQKHGAAGGNLSRWIRRSRPHTRGLMLIYLPAHAGREKGYGLTGEEIVGCALSFPESPTAEPVEYVVNSVFAEEGD